MHCVRIGASPIWVNIPFLYLHNPPDVGIQRACSSSITTLPTLKKVLLKDILIKLKHKPNGKISVNEYDFHYRNLSSREDYTLHEFTPFKNINDLVDSHHSAIRNFISRIIGYFNNTYSVSVEAPKIDEKTLPIDFRPVYKTIRGRTRGLSCHHRRVLPYLRTILQQHG